MPTIPSELAPIILTFQPLMLNRTWEHAIVLLLGAILAPGKRTVSSLLRIMGRRQERRFQNYHRVLNRAAWDLRQGSAILLGLLNPNLRATWPVAVWFGRHHRAPVGTENPRPGDLPRSRAVFPKSLCENFWIALA